MNEVIRKVSDKPSVHGLVHQFQPTPTSCVHACIAMVLGSPVEDILEEVGNHHGLNQRLLRDALDGYGVWYAQTLDSRLGYGWNMVVVPSLNVRGGSHQILVHFEDGKYSVLDPSPKVRYKEDGSDLVSWFDVLIVRPPGYSSRKGAP